MSTINPSLRHFTTSTPTINSSNNNLDLSIGAIAGIIVGTSILICFITLYLFYRQIKIKQQQKNKSSTKSPKSSKSMKESHEYIYRESLLNENDQRYGRSSLVNSKRSSLNAGDRTSVELSPNINALVTAEAMRIPSPSAQRSKIGEEQAIDYGRESMEAQHSRYNDEGIGSLTVMVIKKGDRIEVVEESDVTCRDSILGSTITDRAPTPVDSKGNSLEDRILGGDGDNNSAKALHHAEEHPSSDMYNMEISRDDVVNRYSINGPKATEVSKDSKTERMSQRETEVLFAYNPAAAATAVSKH